MTSAGKELKTADTYGTEADGTQDPGKNVQFIGKDAMVFDLPKPGVTDVGALIL